METLHIDAGGIFWIMVMAVPISIVAISAYFGHKRTEMIHRERMAAIERGIMPTGTLPDPEKNEEEEGPKTPPNFMRNGLFWLCPGLGAVAFSLLFLGEVHAAIRLPILGASMVCAGVGAAYLVIYVVEQDRRHPGVQ
jgi:hypothetical protein